MRCTVLASTPDTPMRKFCGLMSRCTRPCSWNTCRRHNCHRRNMKHAHHLECVVCDNANHLLAKHQHGLEREVATAVAHELEQVRSEQAHDERVVVALRAVPDAAHKAHCFSCTASPACVCVGACPRVWQTTERGVQTVSDEQCHDVKLVLQLRTAAADVLKLDADLLPRLNVHPCCPRHRSNSSMHDVSAHTHTLTHH